MTRNELLQIAAERNFDNADLIAGMLDDSLILRKSTKEAAEVIRECLVVLGLSELTTR